MKSNLLLCVEAFEKFVEVLGWGGGGLGWGGGGLVWTSFRVQLRLKPKKNINQMINVEPIKSQY